MNTPDSENQAQTIEGELWSQAEYRAIFANAIEAIVCIDTRGAITRANPAVETIFGYSPRELIGRNVSCLMPSPDRERHDSYISHYLETDERRIIGIGREVVGLRKDRVEVPLDLSILEIRIDGGRSFVGVMRDISERKHADNLLRTREQELTDTQKQLEHLERLRIASALSTGIAHELTQPLTAIELFAKSCRRLVEGSEIDPDTLNETLSRIETLAHKAGDIIHNLRNLARSQQPGRRPANINPLIENTLELAEMESREQGVHVSLQLAPDLPLVNIAETQIQLVLLNLVRNARESLASQDGKDNHRLVVSSAQLPGNRIQVSVRDNGPGIPRDQINHIFEPFHTNKSTGIGMGLPICRGIIEHHGGTLRLNTDLGEGAEFSFTLPVDEHNDVS